eukprot:518625_1
MSQKDIYCQQDKKDLTVGSYCEIYSRSKEQWYAAEIEKIEGENKNEWLTVRYGNKKNKIKKIQRNCKDLKPISLDHAVFFKKGSNCEIYSTVSRKWCNGEVVSIFHDNEGEWLTIKYEEDNTTKQCDIQRYSKDIKLILDTQDVNKKKEQKIVKFLTRKGVEDPDELRKITTILLISGYIREQCDKIDFEWIMPDICGDVCFDLYFIHYTKNLLDICGDEFIKKTEKDEIITTTFEEDVAGNEIIMFYFSGEWCPPSKAFTPVLAQFYEKCLENNIKLQIIFISCDQNKNKMLDYYKKYHGAYLAIDFDNRSKIKYLDDKYECEYIPMLTVIDNKGELLEQNARFEIANKGFDAIKNWIEI